MGGSGSKEENYRPSSSLRSDSIPPAYGNQGYSQPSYGNQNPQYAQPYYAPESQSNVPPPQPAQSYGGPPSGQPKKALDRRYSRIADNYTSLDQVKLDSDLDVLYL